MRTVSELEKVSFRTHVRNLNALYLLKTRFLASLRNDIITNYDTVWKAGIQNSLIILDLPWRAQAVSRFACTERATCKVMTNW